MFSQICSVQHKKCLCDAFSNSSPWIVSYNAEDLQCRAEPQYRPPGRVSPSLDLQILYMELDWYVLQHGESCPYWGQDDESETLKREPVLSYGEKSKLSKTPLSQGWDTGWTRIYEENHSMWVSLCASPPPGFLSLHGFSRTCLLTFFLPLVCFLTALPVICPF